MELSALLGLDATSLAATIGAVGAFGAAASGLVDATKAFRGGISNVGFDRLRAALEPFSPALEAAVGSDWEAILLAHWRNGKPKAEQKAIATALIHLGLKPETATLLAPRGHVEPAALRTAVEGLVTGRELLPVEVNTLARFKTAVEAKMDAAFERADQAYRNVARVASGAVAMVLSIAGGGILYANDARPEAPTSLLGYWTSDVLGSAILVGLIAVPVAPIAKDLLSSLSAAVHAVKTTRAP